MNDISEAIKRGFARGGVGFTRISNTLAHRRQQFFRDLCIDTVLDVGANSGQYSTMILDDGYKGRLVSFEPIAAPFETLSGLSRRRKGHVCMNMALGSTDREAEINVSENIFSSSMLSVSEESLAACAASRIVRVEKIKVRRLDTIKRDILRPTDQVHLKIDTQGTERDVLLGAAETLSQVRSIELELSLTPMYEHQPLFTEMCQMLESLSYRCVWIDRGFMNQESGHTLQVDGFFIHTNFLSTPNADV